MTPIERLVANGNAIINFLKEFADSNAKDISINWIEDDDTVTTKTFANIEKFQQAVNIKYNNGFFYDNNNNVVSIDAATVAGYDALSLRETHNFKFTQLIDTEKSFPNFWMAGVTTQNELILWGSKQYTSGDANKLRYGPPVSTITAISPEQLGTVLIPLPIEKLNKPIAKLVAGGGSLMVLYQDGTLYSIGLNDVGQLGIGNNATNTNLVKVLNNISDVTTSSYSAVSAISCLAITQTGTLWTWGANIQGQLGNGANTNNNKPGKRTILVTGNKRAIISQIYCCGDYYGSTYVITSEGHVYSCGNNNKGSLGLGDKVNRNTFALVSGALSGKSVSKLAVMGGLNVGSLARGDNTVGGLTSDGEIYTWGYGGNGELGQGNKLDHTTPIKVDITPDKASDSFVDIVSTLVAHGSFFVRSRDGELWGWGSNGAGCLGLGHANLVLSPKRITIVNSDGTQNNSGVKAVYTLPVCRHIVDAGYSSTLIITYDNKVFCSGYNTQGQLGINTKVSVNSFTEINFPYGAKVVQVSKGCAYFSRTAGLSEQTFWNILLNDGRVIGWGANLSSQTSIYTRGYANLTPKLVHS